jgi:hypothetical protein
MNWSLQIAGCFKRIICREKSGTSPDSCLQIINEAISNFRFEIRRRKKYGAGRFHHEERSPAPTA